MMNHTHNANRFESTTLSRLHAYAARQLENSNVHLEFPDHLNRLTGEALMPAPCASRIDLRQLDCFTIDCDDTKDMDDAVSLTRRDAGYALGVHIADVSAYVTPGSALEAEAFARGTSIYLPHLTVPMLPPVLSNDLCSLSPDEDRNAISVLIDLDDAGNVTDYRLEKSLIRSRLKGSYSQVNAILDSDPVAMVPAKYAGVRDTLAHMRELADLLNGHRARAGAGTHQNPEPKIDLRDGEIGIVPQQKTVAEGIIEEFMILANRLVAEYFVEHHLPAIYRVQKEKQTLAGYITDECRHAELALDHYMHFTSPIRRLSDLKVHQVLSAHLEGMDSSALSQAFEEDLIVSAEQASRRDRRADGIQTACRKFCYSQFFNTRANELFPGDVVGRDYKNRLIIRLERYNIRVLGSAGLKACETTRVWLKIRADEEKGTYEAYSLRPLTGRAA